MYALLPWIALVLFVCVAGLWKPLPRSRGRFRTALGFLGLWVTLWAGTSTSWWPLNPTASRQLSWALIALATLQVIAGLVFDFAVEKAGVPRLAGEIILVASYILILFNLFYKLGVNVTGIFATSAVATAVIGLSLQDMLSNIASGVALEFEDDLQVGDYIKCGDAFGWVQHVRLRHTAIETPEGDRVFLPNSLLTRSAVMVLSRSRRQFIPFTMPYAQNPQELTDAVTSALQASPIPGVAADPEPFCIVLEMAPGHIRYAAVVWMLQPGRETFATSAILLRIYFALERAGIPATEITYLLEMKAAADSAGAGANPVDILRRTPIFRLLDDPGLFELGARLHHLSFAPGELIIRQGDEGDSMYFVASGQVAINFAGVDRKEIQVAVISAGEFFGETSLLTGEARNSSAVALTRVDCYQLDKAGLQGIMTRRADLAEDMSVVLAHRMTELDMKRESLDLETARLREAESQTQLLTRIRRFFGLKSNSARA
ncbi:MAG TPA: mechanosensitive ion channel family protein [Bryobacteraceae bacterium]